MESKNVRSYESTQTHSHFISQFPHDEKQIALANKKREIFVQTLKREFIRELQYIWDVANDRAIARDTFIIILVKQLKNLTPRLPVIGDVIDKVSAVADFAVKRERDICIGRVANLVDQLDWQHLEVLMDLVSKEALRRYESIIVDRLSDDPAEGVIPFAKVGARRMLEKLSRSTQNNAKGMSVVLNESILLSGLVEGRSGSFVEGFSNTTLILKRTKKTLLGGDTPKKLDAEDCYARAGMRCFEIREGEQVDELYVRHSARHQKVSTWQKLAGAYKGHPEAFYNFGYVKFRKKKKENCNDPKVGYVVMPLAVIQERYDFKLQEVIKGRNKFKPIKEEEISDELKAEMRGSSHSIIVVDKATVEKFLAWSAEEKNRDKEGRRLGLVDYVKTVLNYPLVKQVVCHDSLVGLDLRGANLSHVDLSGAEIGGNNTGKGGDLTDTDFSHGYLIGTIFKNITNTQRSRFHQTHAEFLQAQSTNFTEADFTLAHLSYSKLGKIKNCKTLGAAWLRAELSEEMKDSEIAKTQAEQTKLLSELKLQILTLSEQQYAQALSEQKIEQEIKALEQKLAETTSSKADKTELVRLQKQIKILQQKLLKNQKEEKLLEKNFASAKSQLEEQIKKLGDEQGALKQLIHKLDNQFQAKLEIIIEEQAKQYRQLENELVTLEETINQRLTMLEGRLDQLEVGTSQINTRIDRVEIEEDKLKVQVSMLQTEGSGLKVKIETLEIKESKINVRVGGLEVKEAELKVEVNEIKQQMKALTAKTDMDIKDEKEKPLSVTELERLTSKLTKILKTYYGSKGTVPGLISDRPQPIADINLTITEQKKEIKQRFDEDVKRIGPSAASSAGEVKVLSFEAGDAKKGTNGPEQKEKPIDQEVLDYYESEYRIQTPIAIETIFDKRSTNISHSSNLSLPDNTDEYKQQNKSKPVVVEKFPKRLLIVGRPGVGKTTMSQYIAYRWANSPTLNEDEKEQKTILSLTASHSSLLSSEKSLWPERFDFVFWIPLRNLSGYSNTVDLAEVIYQECCKTQEKNTSAAGSMSLTDNGYVLSKKELIQVIDYVLKYKKERCLILVDGGDEVAHLVSEPTSGIVQIAQHPIKKLLQQAFDAEYLILTSRPYQISELVLLNPKGFDQELENMGFTDQQIEYYIQNYFKQADKTKALAEELIKFLKSNLRIWGTAHIPIHLALICSAWEEINHTLTFNAKMNVTDLYCEISCHLLKHALERRGLDIRNQGEAWLYQQCAKEMRLLERLAFEGLKNGRVILDKAIQRRVLDAVEKEEKVASKQPLFIMALEMGLLKATSLEKKEELDKEHYFIHLTFQEFLASRYLFSCLNSSNIERVQEAKEFISHSKYIGRYQVLLGFVSGLVSRDKSSSISLTHFWNTVLAQPLDLTGIGYWRIILRCLEEAGCDGRIPYLEKLLSSFKEWAEQILQLRINTVVPNETLKYIFNLLQSFMSYSLVCERAKIIALCLKIFENKKENLRIRANTSIILGELGKKTATELVIQVLLRALKDEHGDMRFAAVSALRNLGEKAMTKPVVQALLQALKDEDVYYVKDVAASALENFGKKAMTGAVIQALSQALEDRDEDVRYVAASALGNLGEKAMTESVIQTLLQALKDEHTYVKRAAAFALENLGEKAVTESVIQALLQALKDRDEDVRYAAALALGNLGEKAMTESVVQAWLQALKDRDEDVRYAAASALGNLGEKAMTESVIQALLQALKDGHTYVKRAAAFALGNLGEKAMTESVIQTLLQALKDENKAMRYEAASLLKKLIEKIKISNDAAILIEKIVCVSLKEMGWLLYNNNIKSFLKETSFPLTVLINTYLNNTHSFLLQLVVRNVLYKNIPITITEAGIILYEGAEPKLFPMTFEKRKNLVKFFATSLRKLGLSDAIPQAYLSGKPIFSMAPVPKMSLTTAKTLHELKEAKENTMTPTAIPPVVPKALTNQPSQIVATSFQAVTVADERKTEVTLSTDEHATFTLEQASALMRRQQIQGGLITPALEPDRIRVEDILQSQLGHQGKDCGVVKLE